MELQKLNDSLDSLHKRMDRFYSWASQLQVEHRDLKQRIGFIESTIQRSFMFKSDEETTCMFKPNDETAGLCGETEAELLARLKAMK